MTIGDQIRDYSTLLEIRQKAYRRNARIATGLFSILLIALAVLGLLNNSFSNSIYFEVVLLVMLGAGALSAWVRLEVLTGTLDLLSNLQRMVTQTSGEKQH